MGRGLAAATSGAGSAVTAGVWIAVFYFGSFMSNVLSKELLGGTAVSSSTLTLIQLCTAVVADGVFLGAHGFWERAAPGSGPISSGGAIKTGAVAPIDDGGAAKPARGPGPILVARGSTMVGTALTFAPISVFIVAGKLSTFASYSLMSMSLAQTAKALEPVFNVVVAFGLYGERRSAVIVASLAPIMLGVALASFSEPSFCVSGFAFATGAGMLKVLQNIYTKRVMDTRTLGFFQLHWWCAVVSLATLLPVLFWERCSALGLSACLDPGSAIDGLSRAVDAPVATAGPAAAPGPSIPWGQLVACAALQYVGSVASYGVLSRVHHLTFTITNTMKRVVIIGGGVLYFANAVTWVNVVGMGVAVAGVMAYNVARQLERKPKAEQHREEEEKQEEEEEDGKEDARAGGLRAADVEGGRAGRAGRASSPAGVAHTGRTASPGLSGAPPMAGSGGRAPRHRGPCQPPLDPRHSLGSTGGSASWATRRHTSSAALRIAAYRPAFGPQRRLGGAWSGDAPSGEATPVVDSELMRVTSYS